MDEKNLKGWKAFLFKSWQPNPTVNNIIWIFLIFGIILIIIGAILTTINMKIIEVSQTYNECSLNSTCKITINITKDMAAPVFLFYEIENFYQNHRRYVRSKSLKQLAGEDLSDDDLTKNCDPITHIKDLKILTFQLKKLKETYNVSDDAVANPCGLIANSFFNDTYDALYLNLPNESKKQFIIDDTGITWPEDKGTKFKKNPNYETVQWIDPEDEHFIVWMRTAGLPSFRKLWGKINETLTSGIYTMMITNNYDIEGFKGSKGFVLSTSGPFGGKNYFISIAYLVIGGICILISLFFFYKKKTSGGKFGMIYKDD